MTPHQTIARFMVSDIITLSPDIEINIAVAQLLEKHISGAPVVDDTGELTGMLTKKDCFRAALNANYYKQWGGTVEQYMTHDPVTLDLELDVVAAAECFLSSSCRLFPVVDDGQLVGILSRSDLLRAFVEAG
ncbi:CBS domain-containing protein [Maritalea mediterranea]|uniref:CBS domain-containing protein n=1 Tax=Maritalea mediterranea TaxID=2909667 RepID=A0ABS9E677_9HYPH|nr:CBS domain-containing protein [Maritalea mediterranea]MCF4098367.1 CBS domain-containing protein [Maritalea mediterranea]